MDKVTPESTMPLEQHLQDVSAAIAAAVDKSGGEGGKAPAASGKEDPLVDAIITSPVRAASMFMAVKDGLAGGSSPAHHGGKSQFLLSGSQGAKPTPVPLVPMGYGEKTAAIKRANKASGPKKPGAGNIFARAEIAGSSLTGGSATDKKKIPMKGAVITPAMAKALGLGGLVEELDVTLRTLQGTNRYEKNPKRLLEDLRKGAAPAKKMVEKLTVGPG